MVFVSNKSNQIVYGNLLYGQSGGPTSVINSSAYGLFTEAFKSNEIQEVYAMHYGLEGLLKEDLIKINKDDNNLSKLLNTPGAVFGSNRFKINYDKDIESLEKIYLVFKKYNIRYFFYNGGNDSMDTIYQISKFLKSKEYECYCIGIPKTIDNDLIETDHTPGYASSAKFIANTITEIYYDDHSYLKGRVNIVEIMGRNTGWLTASSALASINGAKPDLIYVPETSFDVDSFLAKVQKIYEEKHHCLVCVSEGIHDKDNRPLLEQNKIYDAFNHLQLGGVSRYLEELVHNRFGYSTRSFELSLLQRANSMAPSEVDIDEAIGVGMRALQVALMHITDKMVTIKRISNNPYKIDFDLVDLNLVKNQIKYLPNEYIDSENDTINELFFNYALPLISGEEKNHFKNGLLDVYKLEK